MYFAFSMQNSLLSTWQYFLVHAVPPVASTLHVLQPSNQRRHFILGMYSSQNGKVYCAHAFSVQLISFLFDILHLLHPSFHTLHPCGEEFFYVTTEFALGLTQYFIPCSEQDFSVHTILPFTFIHSLHPSYQVSHFDKSMSND